MSDFVPTSSLAFAELSVPESVWTRSARPLWGTALHLYLAGGLGLVALFSEGPLRWGFAAAAVAALVVTPWVIRRKLRVLEGRVARATRGDASRILRELRELRVVRSFAPHAWVTLQEARLHRIAGDGLAAARAFAETARLSRRAGPQPELLGAQVQAWILAGDRRAALEAMRARVEAGALTARDHLSAAVLELQGGGGKEALVHLGRARDHEGTPGCADHPWYVAGMILALARVDRPAEALALVPAAEKAVAGDPVAEELLRRAQKGLRTFARAEDKRERRRDRAKGPERQGVKDRSQETGPATVKATVKAEREVARAPGAGEAAAEILVHAPEPEPERAADPRNPAGSKKARKQQRRDNRRRARAEERELRRREEAARRVARAPQPSATPVEVAPRVEAPRVEAGRAEVPRGATPPVAVPRVEAPRAEVPRVATPPVAVPRVEAACAGAPRVEAPLAEAARVEAPRAEAPREAPPPVAVPRAEAPRVEPTRTEAAPTPAARTEAPRPPAVVLPPLVRPQARASAPEPPRFTLPPLRSPASEGRTPPRPASATSLPPLPTRRASPTGPRPVVPPAPPPAPSIAALDDGWGDLDALTVDDDR